MSLSPDVLFHTGGLEVFSRMDENLAELDIIDEFITENKDSGQEGRPGSHLPGPGSRLAGPGSHLTGPGSQLPGPGSHLAGPGSRLPGPPPPPAELRCGGPPRLGLDSFSSEPVLVARGTAPRTSCSFAHPFPPASRPGEMASAPPCRGASPSGPSRRACGPSPGGPRTPAGPPPAAQPGSGTEQLESLLEAPRLAVSEQPKERGMRFRYECEGRSAGSILGASSTGTTKVQPAIQIQGSIDKVKKVTVTVSLVTKDIPYRPHPHCLVGKDCPEGSGICMVSFNPHTCPQHSFANLGIQCVRRKELDASLQKRRSQNIDPFITGQSKSIEDMDMNVVRLCFQSDLEMEDGRKESLSPVVSNPIYDKKATTTSQLKITCLNINKGPCSGMTEIYMLCDKVQKDDIEIIFRCDAWEGKGEFAQTDVHRQIAIVFKTPPYRDQDISEEFPVDVVLRRVSDRMDSEPVRFTYLPPNPDPYEVKRKRKIKNDISMAEQSCAAGSSSSSGPLPAPPAPLAPGGPTGGAVRQQLLWAAEVKALVLRVKKTLSREMQRVLPVEEDELKAQQDHWVEVDLDADTAHPGLVLSQDKKGVKYGGPLTQDPLLKNPKRFNNNNNNNAFYLEKRLSGHSRTLYITHNKTHNEIYKKRDKIDIERTT
ncbi:transcription factor RelB isoform X2 [Gadus macrocephalus]|uniref:transcription factor RelB isoform X2 n=1 Tax=Gadus macrocephalus TaxID=80720 RepID=UPI0028CB8A82|nr:transcription factor RelB isoform X2 [Gadus macrocephalus]